MVFLVELELRESNVSPYKHILVDIKMFISCLFQLLAIFLHKNNIYNNLLIVNES